jgi:uncharacterized protein (TIGR03435 family)
MQLLPLLLALTAYAADPAFEAASIKPSPPLDSSNGPIFFGPKGGPGDPDPGRYWCNFCNISELIAQAYNLPEYRIVTATRLPEDRFHIVATVPAGATRDQFRAMLQSLLSERFKLTVHRDTRDMQMFRLVVSSGGPKLKPHVDGPPPPVDNKPHAPGVYYKQQGKTTTDLAKVLEGQLRKPVTDATGLSGTYDFDIWWTIDNDPASDAPTIYSAIQALGLKLESHKGTLEVVVVDRVEKPTGN